MDSSRNVMIISFFVGLAFLLTQLSGTIVLPAFPQAVLFFDASATTVKLFLTIYFTGYSLGQLIWGTLSDHYGRRLMYLIALLCYCIASVAVILIHDIFLFYIFYGLLGFSAAAFTSVGNALLKDLFGQERVATAIAIIGIVMACGPSIGSFVGNVLIHAFSWQSIFIFLTLLAVIIILGVFFFIPKVVLHPAVNPLSYWHKIRIIFSNSQFIQSLIILTLSFSAFMAYLDAAPFLFTKYFDLSTQKSGWYLSFSAISYILGAVSVSVLVRRLGITLLCRVGGGACSLSALVY